MSNPQNTTTDGVLEENVEFAKVDLTTAVEELINSISSKFAGFSSEIFAKLDEMSTRLDALEIAIQNTADVRLVGAQTVNPLPQEPSHLPENKEPTQEQEYW